METAPAGARAVAWAGAALFATSLAYFLFTYAVTFGETAAGGPTAPAIVIDVLLFSCFALHHSVFARERVRTWIAASAAGPLERSLYVWVASVMLIAVCALWQPIRGIAWQADGAAAWALHGVQLAGVWLTLRGAAVIDIWDLAGVRQVGKRSTPNHQRSTPKQDSAGSPGSELQDEHQQVGVARRRSSRPRESATRFGEASPKRDDSEARSGGNWEFKTEGPYAWVRHPIYLGWFLLVFAIPAMTMTRLLFAVISSAYILIAIPLEERSLRRVSRGAYDAYMKLVRWKLVPGVY